MFTSAAWRRLAHRRRAARVSGRPAAAGIAVRPQQARRRERGPRLEGPLPPRHPEGSCGLRARGRGFPPVLPPDQAGGPPPLRAQEEVAQPRRRRGRRPGYAPGRRPGRARERRGLQHRPPPAGELGGAGPAHGAAPRPKGRPRPHPGLGGFPGQRGFRGDRLAAKTADGSEFEQVQGHAARLLGSRRQQSPPGSRFRGPHLPRGRAARDARMVRQERSPLWERTELPLFLAVPHL